jgi:hypothetical protein
VSLGAHKLLDANEWVGLEVSREKTLSGNVTSTLTIETKALDCNFTLNIIVFLKKTPDYFRRLLMSQGKESIILKRV